MSLFKRTCVLALCVFAAKLSACDLGIGYRDLKLLNLLPGKITLGIDKSCFEGNTPQKQPLLKSNTGRLLDTYIDGDGFFQVLLQDNTLAYTRRGNFYVNNEFKLVTAAGYCLVPNITFPIDTVNIVTSENGEIHVNVADGECQFLETLQLATFRNCDQLIYLGDGLYKESTLSGCAVIGMPKSENFGSIVQYECEKPMFVQAELHLKSSL